MSSIQGILILTGDNNNDDKEDDQSDYGSESTSSEDYDDESYVDESKPEDDENEEETDTNELKKHMLDLKKSLNNASSVCDLVNIIDSETFQFAIRSGAVKKLLKEDRHSSIVSVIIKLKKIGDPLRALNRMIGMRQAKKTIFLQLMYFLHDLHEGKLDMLHTVIQGSPGVGKTELGKIIANIYSSMGVLKKNKYVIAKRADLIGEYVGHTTGKTQRMINKANGGVLFIDEAYSLGCHGGSGSGSDSYAKECLDVLNLSLTENKDSMMCIIAGYEEALKNNFFSMNEGLRRRFNFTISIDSYTPNELHELFMLKVQEIGWCVRKPIEKHCPVSLFSKHKKDMPFFGGDVESLLFNIKLAHSTRVYRDGYKKKQIEKEDMVKGFDLYLSNRASEQSKDDESFKRMYV